MKGDSLPPFAPLSLSDRGQITDALIARRHSLGWTGEEMDTHAGYSDRYTAKLERPAAPQGRIATHFSQASEVLPAGDIRITGMGAVQLEALGLALVLMDRPTADAIGATPAPARPAQHPRKTGGDTKAAHGQRRHRDGTRSSMALPQYETLDRTHIARLSFKVSVLDHPWLQERPDLLAKANAVEAAMAELQDTLAVPVD
ncbi:hypothetical protein [Brevundimonas sp.]|uniref:hypothetical protein n=1 Tax=Brevundimonas sp. TaxID=1871086 RepID=UPI003BA9B24B